MKLFKQSAPFFFLIALLFLSCAKDDDVILANDTDQTIMSWLDSMNINAKRDSSGIYYYPIDSNDLASSNKSGAIMAIYYSMTTLDGSFTSTYNRTNGDSLLFKQGASAVYPVGIDRAVELMEVGETFGFIIPHDLAYDGLGTSNILTNKNIQIEIELAAVLQENDIFQQEIEDIENYIGLNYLDSLQINPVDSVEFFPASGVFYKRTQYGIDIPPANGDTVEINYSIRTLSDQSLDQRNGFALFWGTNNPRALIPSLEFGLSRMLVQERALILTPSSQAYRESALVIPASVSNAAIEQDIVPEYVNQVKPYQTLILDIVRTD